MKKLIIIIICIPCFFSCKDHNIEDQGFKLKSLPGYVAFDAKGTETKIPPTKIKEDGVLNKKTKKKNPFVKLKVECPTGTFSDINVKYKLSGSAEFGVDYEIAGATASGGEVVVKHKSHKKGVFDEGIITVKALTDGKKDGEKKVTITLESASNDKGNVAVGRGGTDLLKSATIIFEDID